MQQQAEAKLRLLWSPHFDATVCPALLWLWHSSLTDFLTMTGLTNSASAGDFAPEPHLFAPGTAADAANVLEPEPALQTDSQVKPQLDPDAWRSEVTNRLARYRTRRKPRAPRYPSLLLPFETHNRPHSFVSSDSGPTAGSEADGGFPGENATGIPPTVIENYGDGEADLRRANSIEQNYRDEGENQPRQADGRPEFSAKILEFPRSAAIPVIYSTPLADPIFDRPRIVEAPEVVPPAPALGGILIEPPQTELPDRNARVDFAVPSASIGRRLLAAGIDMLDSWRGVFCCSRHFSAFQSRCAFESCARTLRHAGGHWRCIGGCSMDDLPIRAYRRHWIDARPAHSPIAALEF